MKTVEQMDALIAEAIRKVYGYNEEGEQLINHFYYTLSDAESYYGGYGDYRSDNMYTGLNAERLEA